MSGSERSPPAASESAGSPELAAIAQTLAQLGDAGAASDGWKVAVMQGHDTVVCHAVLSTYAQVLVLAERLKPAGFFMTLLESTLMEPEWHFVFRQEDGSDMLDHPPER